MENLCRFCYFIIKTLCKDYIYLNRIFRYLDTKHNWSISVQSFSIFVGKDRLEEIDYDIVLFNNR